MRTSGFVVGRNRRSAGCENPGDARSRTLSAHSQNRGPWFLSHDPARTYLREAQRYAESLRECREAVRLDPLAPFSDVATGWTLLSMGRIDDARQEFRKSLGIDPNYPAGLYFLARVDEQQGRVQEAIALLQKAVASAGRTPKYLNALANAYLLAGKKEEAQRILEELRWQSSREYVDAQMISALDAKLKNK